MIGLLVAAIVAAAWIVPGQMDWNHYRATIETLASATVGRTVTIKGPIRLSLLPESLLSASDVSVDIGSAVGASLTIASLRLRVALMPLLAGRVATRELVLHQPDVRLPWPLRSLVPATGPAPGWLAAFSARLEEGRLSVGDAVVDSVDAGMASAGGDGLSATGTARFQGRPIRISTRLTGRGADGVAGLDLAFDGMDRLAATGGAFSGRLSPEGKLSGRISGRGPDLSLVASAPPIAWVASGQLTATSDQATVDDLAIDLAGTVAHGSLHLRMGIEQGLDLALAAGRLDLEAWMAALPRNCRSFASLPLTLDLSADTASLAGGIARHVMLNAHMAQCGAEVRNASAILPGDASLSVSGRLRGERAQFDGRLSLDAPALRTTANWLEEAGKLPAIALPALALPDGLPRTAKLSGRLSWEPGLLTLDDMDGRIGSSSFTGSLGLRGRSSGQRPSVKAVIAADRIDLGSWLPGLVQTQRGPSLTYLRRLVSGGDADIKLTARHADVRDIEIGDLVVAASADSGLVRLHRLAGRAAGADVVASGAIDDSGRVTDGSLTLTAGDAQALGVLLPAPWRAPPTFWNVPVILKASGSGPPDALAASLSLDFGDGRLEAMPVIDAVHRGWAGSITLRHPGAARLIEALGLPQHAGLPVRPDWLGDGSLSLVAQVKRSPLAITADSFTVSAGLLRASGRLSGDLSGTGPRLTGRVSAETLPLPVAKPWSQTSLPWSDLTGWEASLQIDAARVLLDLAPAFDRFSSMVTLNQGVLTIDHVAAALSGGDLTGRLWCDSTSVPPSVRLDATLSGAELDGPQLGLPIEPVSGHADFGVSLSASGYSPAGLLANLDGRLGLSAHSGSITGMDLGALKDAIADAKVAQSVFMDEGVHKAVMGGLTPYERLTLAASVSGGTITLSNAELFAPSGTVRLTGGANLPADALDLHAVLHPGVPNPPEIGLRVTGGLSGASQRTPELADLTRWLAERP